MQELRQCLGGVVLEVVHENDAPAALFQLTHHRLNHLLGLPHLEVARVDVGEEYPDIALRSD
jgi:hypothetical protein